jgi:hypothetical protein
MFIISYINRIYISIVMILDVLPKVDYSSLSIHNTFSLILSSKNSAKPLSSVHNNLYKWDIFKYSDDFGRTAQGGLLQMRYEIYIY